MPEIQFKKAIKALDLLLAGKTVKQAAYEADIHPTKMTYVKERFPLFLGLNRPYGPRKPEE